MSHFEEQRIIESMNVKLIFPLFSFNLDISVTISFIELKFAVGALSCYGYHSS